MPSPPYCKTKLPTGINEINWTELNWTELHDDQLVEAGWREISLNEMKRPNQLLRRCRTSLLRQSSSSDHLLVLTSRRCMSFFETRETSPRSTDDRSEKTWCPLCIFLSLHPPIRRDITPIWHEASTLKQTEHTGLKLCNISSTAVTGSTWNTYVSGALFFFFSFLFFLNAVTAIASASPRLQSEANAP